MQLTKQFLSKTKIIFGSQAIILSHKVNDVGPMMDYGNLAIFPPFDRESDCKKNQNIEDLVVSDTEQDSVKSLTLQQARGGRF